MSDVNVQAGNGRTGHGPFSLLDGWLPPVVQVVVLLSLVAAIGWRTRRFRLQWFPVCAAVGALGAAGAHLAFGQSGLASDPAPLRLWVWLGLTIAALVLAVVGWRGTPWWRRVLAVVVVPMCALSTCVVLNQWLGYFVNVDHAWRQLTAAPLPNQVAEADLPTLRGTMPDAGKVVRVAIPATASGFRHRDEYVYLPPAWFAGPTPPTLPSLMMLPGEFSTPADWIRGPGATAVVDAYAAAHGGVAPIVVFVDAGGTFNTDTECVDGPRGNAASYLTKDVPPYLVGHFGAAADPRQWGVVGWSMGGTCALTLAVTHPELFDTFYDVSGDPGPTAGTKAQTIDRLYGGDAAAWERFDPVTVLTGHAPYADTAGWIDTPDGSGDFSGEPPSEAALNSMAASIDQAHHLCALAAEVKINCRVRVRPGQHDWPTGSEAFTAALPWLADRLLDPGSPLPTAVVGNDELPPAAGPIGRPTNP